MSEQRHLRTLNGLRKDDLRLAIAALAPVALIHQLMPGINVWLSHGSRLLRELWLITLKSSVFESPCT